jgi:hypothetical protein
MFSPPAVVVAAAGAGELDARRRAQCARSHTEVAAETGRVNADPAETQTGRPKAKRARDS